MIELSVSVNPQRQEAGLDWASIGFVETHSPQHVMFIRLGIAAVLGGAIGFEREATNGSAGLRTHILIATAAALFTLLAFEIYNTALDGGSNNPDPIRAIEAVTAGIAFLGAGAIFQSRGDVRGLTTGAGMWLAGALGVCAALGYYVIALVLTVFAVIVLAALRAFAHRVVGSDEKEEAGESKDKVES
jgi:putative Mg2+ transporter-C (MgtC) family protein